MGTKAGHLVSEAVCSELLRSNRSTAWLADRVDLEESRLAAKLRDDEDFTIVDLAKIADALNIPVATLTPSDPPRAR